MKLIEIIVSDISLSEAIAAVKRNKGALGIDNLKEKSGSKTTIDNIH